MLGDGKTEFVSAWDRAFLDVEHAELYALLNAAHWLDVRPLMCVLSLFLADESRRRHSKLGCWAVAQEIKQGNMEAKKDLVCLISYLATAEAKEEEQRVQKELGAMMLSAKDSNRAESNRESSGLGTKQAICHT
jgi:hypothetical protein